MRYWKWVIKQKHTDTLSFTANYYNEEGLDEENRKSLSPYYEFVQKIDITLKEKPSDPRTSKAYKVTFYLIDVASESYVKDSELVDKVKNDLGASSVFVEGADIGIWHDAHPLNKGADFESYFKGEGEWIK